MTAALRLLSPGALTTVQDLGRPGHQRLGLPVGGALDPIALRAANALVGNAPDMGAWECVGRGPAFIVDAPSARVAFVGAAAEIRVTPRGGRDPDLRFEVGASFTVQLGDCVRVGKFSRSLLLYMAVEGGFDIAPVLGSVSTYLRGELGGWQGRALKAGDSVPLARDEATPRGEVEMSMDIFAPHRRIRVVEGPQADFFSADEFEAFVAGEYVVGSQWSRMGARLEGRPLQHARGFNIVSDALTPGAIQVPGDGLPIVLMREHQTTGGYPKIATVISADLPAFARLAPGERFRFERVSMGEAAAARREMAALMDALPSRIAPVRDWRDEAPLRLFEANLISGVFDAGVANG
jgi:biotin-dependent carboxylase-like uncharacterized protein